VTKAAILIEAIRKAGTIRTTALAEATGIAAKDITALLTVAERNGHVHGCTVEIPGKHPQREYRIGGGMAAQEFTPLKSKRPITTAQRPITHPPPPKPAKADPGEKLIHPFLAQAMPGNPCATTHPQPAVGNAGSVASASSSVTTPAKGHYVATPPAGKTVSAASRPGNETDMTGAIGLSIDNLGALTLVTEQRVLALTPEQTLALGDFLACCDPLWSQRV
jgi:hypothetical protein